MFLHTYEMFYYFTRSFSDGNLMEQVELLKKNIRSLEYKNDGLNEVNHYI